MTKVTQQIWEKLKSATSPSFSINVFSQTFQQLFSFLFRIAFSIIISRSLGPYGRGLVSTLAEFLGFAGLVASIGLFASVQYHIASRKCTPKEGIGNYLFFVLVYSYVFVLVLMIFSPFLITHLFKGLPSEIFIISLIFFAVSIYFTPLDILLSAFQRFPQMMFIVFILYTLRLCLLVFFLVVLKLGIWGALLPDWFLFPIGVYLRFYFLKDIFHLNSLKPTFNKGIFKNIFNYGWKVFTADIFTQITLRADVLIISAFQTPQEVGFYTIAVNYTELLLLIPLAFATVLFPRVSSLEEDPAKRLTLLLTRSLLLYIIPISLLLCAFASKIIPFFYGVKFMPSVAVVGYLLPRIVARCYGMQISNYLSGRGHPELVLYTAGSAALISLVGDFLLIPLLSIKGAAIVSSLAYTAYFLLSLYFFKQIAGVGLKETLLPSLKDMVFLYDVLKKKLNSFKKQ